VYELGNDNFIKSTIMDGNEKLTFDDMIKMLNLGLKDEVHKFLQNIGKKRQTLLDAVDSLQPDPWLCQQEGRYQRSTYLAIQACIALGAGVKSLGGRIVACLGGPATIGEGLIASLNKADIIRAHYDLEDNTEKLKVYEDAVKVYREVANKMILNQLTLDVFAFSTDQFGLGEMKALVDETGGLVFMHEEFNSQIFFDNFKNYFALNDYGELKVASGATIEMFVTNPLLIKGAFGPIHSDLNKHKMASKSKLGEGETNSWFVGGLDHNLSLTFFLDVQESKTSKVGESQSYLQFATKYKHPTGAIFLRVTTVLRSNLDSNNIVQFLGGVDQETVIAVLGKMAARKSLEMDSIPVIRWLDRILILVLKRFCDFKKSDKATFKCCDELYLLPQFFYYLRKSTLIRKFAT
jgi:protein transport protein SEC23